MEPIITHFTDNDLYTFTCQYYVLQTYPRAEVEYNFFDRNNTCYPLGFDSLLREQMNHMKDVIITDEEIAFMQRKCYYLPKWYFTFLRGYRFNPDELSINQDDEGHLNVIIRGKWHSAIMWEMPVLSVVSELAHRLNGDLDKYNKDSELERTREKGRKILLNGLVLSDMGTRRLFSFEHQDITIRELAKLYKEGGIIDENGEFLAWTGKFIGTSNVYLAMKHNLTPVGTMSHQLVMFEETVSGVFECNYNVMKKFSDVYDGDNGVFLYDAFGDKVFFNNLSKRMAMMYKGLRVDSGVEEEQIEKIIAKYSSLGIDPVGKQVIFSNGLDVNRALEIHKYVNGRLQDSYGVGTNITCDISRCSPMNIVVKLTRCRITESREWHDCVKLSCDKGKTLGNPQKCAYLLSVIS